VIKGISFLSLKGLHIITRGSAILNPPSKTPMRDKQFIVKHRGGLLTKERHRQLMKWSCDCATHVLPLFGGKTDERLKNALFMAKEWAKGRVSVGDARKASLQAIVVAHEVSNPGAIAVARAVGHAVATAHMADHSLGAALYALKAVKNAGGSADAERKWQIERLPREIRELVLSARVEKDKALNIS